MPKISALVAVFETRVWNCLLTLCIGVKYFLILHFSSV